MGITYIKRYNRRHLIKKVFHTHHNTVKQNIPTLFRTSPEMPYFQRKFNDPEYQLDIYWDDHLYDEENFEFNNNLDKSPEQFGKDHIVTKSHVSYKLRDPNFDLWTVNPQIPNTSPLSNFRPRSKFLICQIPVIDTEVISQLKPVPGKIHEILIIIDKPPNGKQKEDAIFSDGFRKK